MVVVVFECDGDQREINGRTHSFPTRRSSDLRHGGQPTSAADHPRNARYHCATAGHKPSAAVRASAWLKTSCHSSMCAPAPRTATTPPRAIAGRPRRSEEHTSELQSLMRISYAVFCLKKKKIHTTK